MKTASLLSAQTSRVSRGRSFLSTSLRITEKCYHRALKVFSRFGAAFLVFGFLDTWSVKLMTLDAEPIRQNNPAPNAGHEAKNQTEQANQDMPVRSSVPASPPPKTHYEITCKHEKDFWEKFKDGAEILGICLLLVYTVYTIKMYRANKQAASAATSAASTANVTLKSSQKAFELDQRAWVSPKVLHQIFAEMQPLVIATQFDNTGKTPAVKVKTCQVAEIVENTRPSVDLSCPERAYSPGFDVIFPGNHLNRISNAAGDGGKVNISHDGLLRKSLMDELRHHAKTVYVYGRVDYCDAFKTSHWATFCSTMLIMQPTSGGLPETVSWMSCQIGNDIGDGQTEKCQ
jgi:hypothetical protein